MKKYIGAKLVQARPMTRGAYNRYRGWEIPADENPEEEGYLIQYPVSYTHLDVYKRQESKQAGFTGRI